MAQPYDYTPQPPRFLENFTAGLQVGDALRQRRLQEQQQQQQQQQQSARLEQYQIDVQEAFDNPSARAFAILQAKYPEQSQAFGETWNTLNEDQKDAEFRTGLRVFNAVQSGRPDLAIRVLEEQAQAEEYAGKDATDTRDMIEQLRVDPKSVASHAAHVLSASDPDRFSKYVTALHANDIATAQAGKSKADQTSAEYAAQKAAVESKFYESNALAEAAKKGADLDKVLQDIDIGKLNAQIAVADAEARRTKDAAEKAAAERAVIESKTKRDDMIRAKLADQEATVDTINILRSTVKRLINTPEWVRENAHGTIDSEWIPTIRETTSDYEQDLETLGSQIFLAKIPIMKGSGAIGVAEGTRLENAIGSLSLKQSASKTLAILKIIDAEMAKAEERMLRFGWLPSSSADPDLDKYAPEAE